jgi:hypothetical protein
MVTGAVGIFDADDELAVIVAGIKPIEESCPGGTNVKVASWAGSNPDTHRFVGHIFLLLLSR